MKRFLNIKILAPLLAVLLLGGGTFAVTQFLHVDLRVIIGSKASAEGNATPTPEPGKSSELGIVYSTAERVVNLADESQYRYLKTQVSLEFAMPKGKKVPSGQAYVAEQKKQDEELSPYKARIDDVINGVLTSKSSTELLKSEGKEELRAELLEKLREQLGEDLGPRLMQIYFVQFIIQ